jgi:glucan phosphoethanolaminetransferase (alkaline phosphatase superfamily)
MLSILFLKGGILIFSEATGSVIKLTINGVFRTTEQLENTLPITLNIFLIPLLSAIITGLFKNRSIQLFLSKILIALILLFIILLAFYSFSIINKYDASLTPGFKMMIPVIQLILAFLAYRGIKKDDDLVKSYDRLR